MSRVGKSFSVKKCTNCKKIVWPPSSICDVCFGYTESGQIGQDGRIVEVSRDGNGYFAIVELDANVRVLGAILGGSKPEVGQMVRLVSDEVGYVFEL